jgi:sugar phosphate isomerase/epimerase
MRIGIITDANEERLDWARDQGFKSIGWNRFEISPACVDEKDWQSPAREFADVVKSRGLRISTIGALYKNPLDPEQSDYARKVFLRAIEVAALIGVNTVSGFPGAVIEFERHPKGNNLIYKPFENFLPQFLQFWEPIARRAAEVGVRLAFEHCPMAPFHLPVMSYNMLSRPSMWERLFDATSCENIGIEWDASHLMCQFVDPVENIHKFGERIFHVHAKDAFINHRLLQIYGICHEGVAEHRFPGFGQGSWSEIVHALLRAGYDSDLNIEGWHDPVFRDHDVAPPADIHIAGTNRQSGQKLEEAGLILAHRHLAQFVPPPNPV